MSSGYVLEADNPLVYAFYRLYPASTLETIVLSHITWIPEQATEPPIEYSIPNCRQKKIRMSGERQIKDVMSEHLTTFQIPRESLPLQPDGINPIAPVPADWIYRTKDGVLTKWNILSVTKQLIESVYNCDCERFDDSEDTVQ